MTTPENPEQGPLNEWLFDEYIRVKDALTDLSRRHEEIVNHLVDVCRRNDRMLAAGNDLRDHLLQFSRQHGVEEAIQKWGEANV
jgi:hypothetical protein